MYLTAKVWLHIFVIPVLYYGGEFTIRSLYSRG